ncbi:MAG: CopG family transcriptional regulator [Patescibacteria group bacterium]|nr:CopG family transcriptional regulator [Patescibacteria group bacterium]
MENVEYPRHVGEKMPVISISLDSESEDKLGKIAKKLDRNISDTVRQLIKEYEL